MHEALCPCVRHNPRYSACRETGRPIIPRTSGLVLRVVHNAGYSRFSLMRPSCQSATSSISVRYSGGGFTQIAMCDAAFTEVSGINNAGEIVKNYVRPNKCIECLNRKRRAHPATVSGYRRNTPTVSPQEALPGSGSSSQSVETSNNSTPDHLASARKPSGKNRQQSTG